MAMGVAFVTGLLQGSIDKRQAAIQAVQDQKDAEAAAAAKTAEFTVDLVKSGKVDTNSEGFKNFQKTGDVKYLVNVSNTMDKVSKTTAVGGITFGFRNDGDSPMVAAGKNMVGMNTQLVNPSFYADAINQAKASPTTLKATLDFIASQKALYQQKFWLDNSGKDAATGKVTVPRFADFSGGGFNALLRFETELQDISGTGQGATEALAIAELDTKVNIATSGKGLKSDEFYVEIPDIVKEEDTTQQPDVSAGAAPKPMVGGIFKFESEQQAMHVTVLADKLGFANVNMMFKNLASISKFGKEDFYRNKEALLNAAQLNAAGVLNFDSVGGTSDAENIAVTQTLADIGGPTDNLSNQIAAVYPLMAVMYRNNPATPAGIGTGNISGAQYLANQKIKAGEVREVYEAADLSVGMLEELIKLEGDLGTTGVVREFQKIGAGLFGEGGTIDQMFGSGKVRYREDDASSLVLADTARKVLAEQGFTDVSGPLGRIESLKIALAAKMARAVDPAGRLSNQDFEMQLRRLGDAGFFSSTEFKKASLQQVLEEFTEKRNSVERVYRISGMDSLEEKDFIEIKAYKVVDNARRMRKKYNINQPVVSEDSGGMPKPEGPAYITDTDTLNALNKSTPDPSLATQDGSPIYETGGKFYSKDDKGYLEVPQADVQILQIEN